MRVSRRFAVLTFLACVLLAQAVLALVLLGGDQAGTATALPLHPVIGTFEPDDTTLDECAERACFEQAYGNVAFREGPRAALELLDEGVASERVPADGTCHRIAHTIGAASLARYRGNVARTFAEGSASCWSGYYHGALERSLSKVRSYNPDALGAVVRELCADRSLRAVPWLGDQCVHGIGHGLMIATGYSLPLSLRVCERLEAAFDQTSCKGGVFMENVSSSYGFRSRWVKDDDPIYPCNAVERDDRETCFRFATARILPSVDWSWQRTAGICAEVGEQRLAAACFDSFGRDAASQSRLDPAEILRICVDARRYGHESACVAGAARTMVGNFTGGREAAVLCVDAPARLRGDCFTAVGRALGRFTVSAEKRAADCHAIAVRAGHVAACIRGAQAGPL